MARKKTEKEVWDSLKLRFVSAERVKEAWLQTLNRELDAMRMKEDAARSICQEIDEDVSCNLSGMLDDTALVKKLFDTLPKRFLNVVVRIERFYDLSKLAFDEAIGRLKVYDERTNLSGKNTKRTKEVGRRRFGGGRSQDASGRLGKRPRQRV